ncbi:hypothetical protein BH11BAC2_BH11BAC2_23790 [soil metagenome]
MKSHFRLLFLFFVLPLISYSQHPEKIDSILNAVKKFDAAQSKSQASIGVADTMKVSAWLQLSREFMNDPDKANFYAEKALSLAQQTGVEKYIGNAASLTGVMYYRQGRYEESLKMDSLALNARKKDGDEKGMASVYNNIGVVYEGLGNNILALTNHTESLRIRRKLGDQDGISSSYNNIGNIYYNQGNYPEALKNHFAGLKINEAIKDTEDIAKSYFNIANIYSDIEDNRQAMQYYLSALAIFKEKNDEYQILKAYNSIGNLNIKSGNYQEGNRNYQLALAIAEKLDSRHDIALIHSNIGTVLGYTKQTDEALNSYLKSLGIFQEIGDQSGIANTKILIGQTYFEKGDYQRALTFEEEALILAHEAGAIYHVNQAHENLAKIYYKLKDFKRAYDELQIFKQGSDSIYNAENNRKITRQQLQYEYEKKEAEQSATQEKKDVVQRASIQKQKVIKNTSFVILGLMIILALGLFYRFNEKRKANELLSTTLENLKHAQRQLIQSEKLASLGQLTAGIAHEIQNPLNFVNNFSGIAKDMIGDLKNAATSDERNEVIHDLEQNLDKIETHGKRASGIVKSMLLHSHHGFNEVQLVDLNTLCSDTMELTIYSAKAGSENFNIQIQKKLDPTLPKVPLVQQEISRVLINLITNSVFALNGRANGEIMLSTKLIKNFVEVKVRDNGSGIPEEIREQIFEPFFTTRHAGEGTGLGLSISYDIIQNQGGILSVDSKPGEWTEFTFTLPLKS